MASKIFITGLPFDATDNDIREYFQRFGALEMAYVVKQTNLKKKSRIGYVSFVRLEDKETVLAIKNHKMMNNRIFVCEY